MHNGPELLASDWWVPEYRVPAKVGKHSQLLSDLVINWTVAMNGSRICGRKRTRTTGSIACSISPPMNSNYCKRRSNIERPTSRAPPTPALSLLALNQEVAAKIENDSPVTAPGVPKNYPDAKKSDKNG